LNLYKQQSRAELIRKPKEAKDQDRGGVQGEPFYVSRHRKRTEKKKKGTR